MLLLSNPLEFMPFATKFELFASDGQNDMEQSDDPDEYDDLNEANVPWSPIWDGAPAHESVFGTKPIPLSQKFDSNEITQD